MSERLGMEDWLGVDRWRDLCNLGISHGTQLEDFEERRTVQADWTDSGVVEQYR